MPNAGMTVHTIEHFVVVAWVGGDQSHQPLMATHTIFLHHGAVVWFDLNRLMEILQCKTF